MRVIVEVDNEEELRETLELLKDRMVTVTEAPAPSRRETLLREAVQKYQIKLPEDWEFDRAEAHER